ncbi:DUF3189 family protein [Halanaerobaculum tunisiense]
MKVIYYCYGSAHSSVLAAAIHVGKLPLETVPTKNNIQQLPHYDKTKSYQIGTPFYYGQDEGNNQIYILGMGNQRKLIKGILFNFLELCDIDSQEIMLVAALPYVNWITKLGGLLSRRYGLVSLGRPLTIYSLQKAYFQYVDLVTEVKERLNSLQNNS